MYVLRTSYFLYCQEEEPPEVGIEAGVATGDTTVRLSNLLPASSFKQKKKLLISPAESAASCTLVRARLTEQRLAIGYTRTSLVTLDFRPSDRRERVIISGFWWETSTACPRYSSDSKTALVSPQLGG